MASLNREYQERERSVERTSVAQVLKSAGEYKPSVVFRIKIFLFTLSPRLSMRLVSMRLDEHGRARKNKVATLLRKEMPQVLKPVSVAVAAVVLALVIFGALYAASFGGKPGDTLYFVKRIRERFEIALSRDNLEKVRRQLAHADLRLKELGEAVKSPENAAEPEGVRAIVNEYAEKLNAAVSIVTSDEKAVKAENQAKVSGLFKSIKRREARLVGELVRSSPQAILAPCASAKVTLAVSGAGSAEATRAFTLTTGRDGTLSISPEDLKKLTKKGESDFEVRVEADGRVNVLPLVWEKPPFDDSTRKASTEEKVLLEAEAVPVALRRMEKVTLRVSLRSGGGELLKYHKVAVSDISRSSLVNRAECCLLATDEKGEFEFEIQKTDPSRVSVITVRVLGETTGWEWLEAKRRIRIGGILEPCQSPQGNPVKYRAYEDERGFRAVELENGKVRVKAYGSTPGEILRIIEDMESLTSAGPVIDPLIGVPGNGPGKSEYRNLNGPYLFEGSRDIAGYEVSYEFKLDGSWARRKHLVLLPPNTEYAVVISKIEKADGTPIDRGLKPSFSRLFELRIPYGREIIVSGNRVPAKAHSAGAQSAFQVSLSKPYACLESAQRVFYLGFPPVYAAFAKNWSVTSAGLGVVVDEGSLYRQDNPGVAWVMGFSETDEVMRVFSNMHEVIADPVTSHLFSNGFTSDFTFTTRESGERKSGEIVVGVFKTYESVTAGK